MALSFQTPGTGTKTNSGSTFTIVLNSTAGDQIVVVVCADATAVSVSSITDNGGNTYHQMLQKSGTNINSWLWKTDAVSPAASGTITITMSVTNTNCAAVAATYRNVAFEATGAATSITSSTVSHSVTLSETNSWAVMGAATRQNITFTATSGTIRGQVSQSTTLSAMIIDSNGGASPAALTATMGTSASSTMMDTELRLLESSQLESMTMTDQAQVQALFVVADTIGLTGNWNLRM